MTERFGAKRVWMISVGLFGAGSALCGLAWSDGSLIFFRVLQGFGGGMIMPVGMSLLAQTAGPQRVGRVMSVVGVPILLGPILGPVIGGAIVERRSWRWIFYVNVPIAVMALVLAARRLSADSGRADAGRLDWRGFLLLAPGLVGIVFGLSEIETQGGISHPIAFGPIVAGLALIGAFAIYSYRAPRPLIDVRLFRSRGFSAATATTFFIGAALFGAMLLLPLYYQVARGESPLTAGLLIAPQGLGAALVMPISGRLTDRIGGGRVALFGTAVVALATIPFAFVGAHTSYSCSAHPGGAGDRPRLRDDARDGSGVRGPRLGAGSARHQCAQRGPAGWRRGRHSVAGRRPRAPARRASPPNSPGRQPQTSRMPSGTRSGGRSAFRSSPSSPRRSSRSLSVASGVAAASAPATGAPGAAGVAA